MIRKDLNEILTSKGLNSSPARLKVLSVCRKSDIPLDVNAVAAKVGSKAHLATIYRTLEKFVTTGILERIDFQEGKFRYEFVQNHHHHAVCEDCGKVEDVQDQGIEVIEKNLKKDSGFLVTKHTLELFGMCSTCQSQGAI